MTPSIKATPKTEEATLKQQMKYALMNPKHILKLYEAETGARYCVHCRDMLPLGNFLRPQKYALCHFSCKLHRKVSPGRPIKYRDPDAQLRRKAALSIVARARDDKAMFKHHRRSLLGRDPGPAHTGAGR